jgi:GNAT superfamily N-acetyltransferase
MSNNFKSIDNLFLVRRFWSDFGIKYYLCEYNDGIRLEELVVPKDKRKQGIGSLAMNCLIGYADNAQKRIVLSPSIDHGASSLNRLFKFYGRFGFVRNKGRHKDYSLSYTMYRLPLAKEGKHEAC